MAKQWIALTLALCASTAAFAANNSQLLKSDGTVISPVPEGTKLEEGDKLVVSEGSLKVMANGTEMVVSAGSNLSVTKGEGKSMEIFLERGRAETKAPATAGPETVYLVTKDGGRLRADEQAGQSSVAEVGGHGPTLQVKESGRELATTLPLPPPPPPARNFGQAQFEPAPSRGFEQVVPVPKVEVPSVSCPTCPANVRLTVRVQ